MGKPEIRFKGYTDEWEQRKFSDIAARESFVSTSASDIPSVEYEDVVAEEGRLNKDIRLKEAVKSGITFDGSQVLYGKLRPYLHNWLNPDFKGIAVGDWWVLKPINMDKNFLYRLIQTQQFDNIANQSSGSKMPRADWNLISNSEFMVPFSKEEQSKIGRYFDSLDNLITLQQRKCDEVKSLKKYMLQKMFPQNEQKVPEIRFEGFTEAWEQRKLGDVLERRIEQRQQSEEYPRLAFASGQGVIPLSERKTNNREQLTKDEYTKKYLVTELNDIVYNPANVKYGAIDRNKCRRGLISPIYVTFTTNEIPGFIERIVTSHDFQQRALRFEEGTVTKRQSVNPEDLVTLDILVAPKREEQQKIATYFDSLDHLITLHQQKCEELKKIKKFMLQKMFV